MSSRPDVGSRADPPGRDPSADPDVDGVALAAATAAGVLAGTRFAVATAWIVATLCLAAACLGAGAVPRLREESGASAVVGVLVLSTLLASGGAAAAVRATAVKGGILLSWVRQPARVEVTGTVAEEPRRVRYGGHWVVLTVTEVRRDRRTYRTRERAGMIAPASGSGSSGPTSVPGPRTVEERLAVGDRLRVRASVGEARWSDALGRQPPVVLRNPVIEERAPPQGRCYRSASGCGRRHGPRPWRAWRPNEPGCWWGWRSATPRCSPPSWSATSGRPG